MSGWGMNDLEPQEKKVENEKPTPEVQGFNLSQDYELLWRLICNGYRVPGWLRYPDRFDEPWYDIVEIKIRSSYENKTHDPYCYSIGSRGVGYEWGFSDKEKTSQQIFTENCKKNNLWFAIPNYKIPLL